MANFRECRPVSPKLAGNTQAAHLLATVDAVGDNHFMSLPLNPLFESALSLPQAERADLAFQLLQTLAPSGDEISAAEFGAELHGRIEAHRRGELPSYDLNEARKFIEQRIGNRQA